MHPKQFEVIQIYHLWKTYFGFDDGGSIDDYFKRNFSLEACYVLRKDGTIVACLCAHPHTMMLHGKKVNIRFISGVITKQDVRHRGYMKELFALVFQDDPTCALWVLQAYQPEIYASLGFVPTYFSTIYHLAAKKGVHSDSFCEINDAPALATLAATFLNDYDGYILHDAAWYENIIQETKARGGKLVGLVRQQVLAYAICFQEENAIYIEEVMYQSLATLDELLAHLATNALPIELQSFACLPYPKQDEKCTLLVRLGNCDTLKNIEQAKITSLNDVYTNSKTLYHYSFW